MSFGDPPHLNGTVTAEHAEVNGDRPDRQLSLRHATAYRRGPPRSCTRGRPPSRTACVRSPSSSRRRCRLWSPRAPGPPCGRSRAAARSARQRITTGYTAARMPMLLAGAFRQPRRARGGSYLSDRHRPGRPNGCAVAALGADVARRKPGAAQDSDCRACASRSTPSISLLKRGTPAARRRRALAACAGMVGALFLARAVDDPALAQEILTRGKGRLSARRPRTTRPFVRPVFVAS